MAGKAPIRRNEQLLRWLRAVGFAGITVVALLALAFEPVSIAYAGALIVGVLALFAPGIAVLAVVILVSLPLLAADLLVGAAFLIIGFATVQYMGQNNGRAFLIIGLAFIGAYLGPAWTAAIVAGYLLGASEGAVVAILACLALQAAGIVTGQEYLGVVYAGGTAPGLVSFENVPDNLLGFGWLSASLEAIDPGALLGAFTGASGKGMLVLQPVIWAVGAALAGSIRKPLEDPKRALFAFGGAAVAAVWFAGGTILAGSVVETPVGWGAAATAAVGSLIASAVFIAAWEWVFPLVPREAPPAVRPGSMSAEDADVDELLRLIATAEDQLASKHTTDAVVMITDMKSFSKMTEEEGSFVSAKTIQRHRDLLLPVIARHSGKGKSTGGDGLVASFPTSSDAIAAAMDMQRTLRTYNADHQGERDIIIRCGMASGEVVLDKGGRPFIGAALNMAARVMNLGDGGQILTTNNVAAEGAPPAGARTHSHGLFVLKNIAEPTEVVEIMWAEDQQPLEPQGMRAEGIAES